MWRLCALCFLLSALLNVQRTVAEYDNGFRKCCAQNESLVIIKDESESFDCVDSNSANQKYNITNFSKLIISDNIALDLNYGVPENCTWQMVPVTEVDLNSTLNDVCYDIVITEIINGSLIHIPKTVSLSCEQNDTETLEPKVTVELFRKCCPSGEAFDSQYHFCRPIKEESTTEWLLTQFNLNSSGYVYDVETGLNCKSEEYSVELSREKFSLELDGSVLKVLKDRERKMARGDWCVDRDYNGKNVIARVCTPHCSEYKAFCYRKCCPLGQHYQPFSCGNSRSVCVPNVDIIFNMSYYLEPLEKRYDNLLGEFYVCHKPRL